MKSSPLLLIAPVIVTAYSAAIVLIVGYVNPTTAVPRLSYPQIIEATRQAGMPIDSELGVVVAMGLLGPAATIVLSLLARAHHISQHVLIRCNLALLVLGVPWYWLSAFSPGMTLADTFAISGGDHSGWSSALYAVSAVALVSLIAHIAFAQPKNRLVAVTS